MSIFSIFKKEETRQFFPHIEHYFGTGIFSVELNSAVDNAVSKISNTISILPMSAYVYTKNGKTEAFWTPVYKVLQDPCIEESRTLFMKTLVRHILLKGNAYIYKGYVNGEISWLQLVSPESVTQVSRDKSGRKLYHIRGERGGVFTDNEIIHIPYLDEGYNGTLGRSPMDIHRELVEQNNILNEYISLYFKNGVSSKLIFELGQEYVPGKANLEKLVQELNSYYKAFWGGSRNSGLPGIVPPGTSAKFLESSSNVQAQLDQALKYSEAQIYKAFNIPPEVLMSSENKYGSLQQKNADFLQSCIQPLCLHICECLKKGLTYDEGITITFDYNGLLETDISLKQDRLIKGITNGLYTLNEARQQMNLSVLDNDVEGNTRLVSASLIPWTEENINSILSKSKIALMESHSPIGDDKI